MSTCHNCGGKYYLSHYKESSTWIRWDDKCFACKTTKRYLQSKLPAPSWTCKGFTHADRDPYTGQRDNPWANYDFCLEEGI
jgi:hypothetical protein